jgi:hypothetical protein
MLADAGEQCAGNIEQPPFTGALSAWQNTNVCY